MTNATTIQTTKTGMTMTMKLMRTALGCGLLAAAPVSAQLPSASAADLGMGGARTATVRGFAAIATNPAGLGMSGPGFSLAILPVGASSGLDPIQLADLANYSDRLVPASVREQWLDRVARAGDQSGTMGLSVTAAAFTIGSLGFQFSTAVAGELSLNADATELVLFGNAGRTGEPRDFSLEGSKIDGYAISTAAISYGARLNRNVSLGATLKFMAGNGVIIARDGGSAVTSDPVAVNLRFPSLVTADGSNGHDSGSGTGLDLGVQWRHDDWSFGATIRNAFNTFEWDLDKLAYRPGTALFDGSDSESDFDERPGAAAPAALLTTLDGLTLDPEVALGASWYVDRDLRLSGEFRNRFGDGVALEPKFHLGAGAEFTGLNWLPLRVHAAKVSNGVQFGGGLSLVLGPVHASWSLAGRSGDLDDEVMGAFSLTFGSH